MRAGRIIGAVLGGLLTFIGFVMFAVGATLVVFNATQRGDDGYFASRQIPLETSTSALVTYVEMTSDADWDNPLGTVRVDVTARNGEAVFAGIGPADQVRAWLSGTRHERARWLGIGPMGTRTEQDGGTGVQGPVPGEANFWVASVSGPGRQQLRWDSDWGDWALVVMNADGGAGVSADVAFASDTGVLLPLGLIVGGLGLLALVAGAVALVFALRGAPAVPAAPGQPGSYPVRLDAALDPGLSRGLWLIKWFLAIPHLLVLLVLYLAMLPLTIAAGLAIVFTGRYPRPIFDFNVGVMRWGWRVSYYAFNTLGTDRYPPFSLRPDPNFPADFTVEYPQRLSRALVLVKWWLLAIPHYLVVAIFTGGWIGWWDRHGWRTYAPGLIGLLTFIALVVLLFTARYPRDLFSFLMGLNRWCYRVMAYAMLMRDEYPPFRLDPGGTDPGTVTEPGQTAEPTSPGR